MEKGPCGGSVWEHKSERMAGIHGNAGLGRRTNGKPRTCACVGRGNTPTIAEDQASWTWNRKGKAHRCTCPSKPRPSACRLTRPKNRPNLSSVQGETQCHADESKEYHLAYKILFQPNKCAKDPANVHCSRAALVLTVMSMKLGGMRKNPG